MTAKLAVDFKTVAAWPNALDALKAMTGATNVSDRYGLVTLTLNGAVVSVDFDGSVYGNRYNQGEVAKVKDAIEKLSKMVLVEQTKARISALAKATGKVQYLDNGTLVMEVTF
jgi:hypothetical protein